MPSAVYGNDNHKVLLIVFGDFQLTKGQSAGNGIKVVHKQGRKDKLIPELSWSFLFRIAEFRPARKKNIAHTQTDLGLCEGEGMDFDHELLINIKIRSPPVTSVKV